MLMRDIIGRIIAVILAMGLVGCSAIELNQRNAQATARAEANIAATVDSRAAAFQADQSRPIQAPEATAEAMPSPTASPFAAAAADIEVYGRVPIDSDRLNSITALAFDGDGHLLAGLRAGEIYRLEEGDEARLIFEDQGNDIGQVSGLFARGDALIIINDQQLSQLRDGDGDGFYETVTQLSTALPAYQSPLQAGNSIIQSPDGRYFTADVNTGEILQIILRG